MSDKPAWREKWEHAEGHWFLIHSTAASLAVALTFLAGCAVGFLSALFLLVL
jgi:hypothetical protein